MKTLSLLLVRLIVFVFFVAILSCVFTYPLQLAINHTFSAEALTAVFGTSYVSFSKAWLLSFLTSLLFKTAK